MKKPEKTIKSSVQISKAQKKKLVDKSSSDIMLEILRLYKDKGAKAYYISPGPLVLKSIGDIKPKNIVQSHLFKIRFPKGIVIEVFLKDVAEVKKKVDGELKSLFTK